MESPVNIRFLHQYKKKKMNSVKPSEARRGLCSNRKKHIVGYGLFCTSVELCVTAFLSLS